MDLLLLLLLLPLPLASSSCVDDASVLASAFASVSNFHPPECADPTANITSLRYPSRNLTGTVAWALLRSLPSLRSVDLSGNSLRGSLPGAFWSHPSLLRVDLSGNRLGGPLRFAPARGLRTLNLSANRFTAASGAAGLFALRSLDLSRNRLTLVPAGLGGLRRLKHLDLSYNSMSGDFSRDFPVIPQLQFLNVSYNNFTGSVSDEQLEKFGRAAFIKAGSITFSSSTKKKNHLLFLFIVIGVTVIIGIIGCVVARRRRRRKGRGWKEEERGVRAAEEVPAWVAEARWAAPVVVFERPLMELRFSDLAAATSGFGRESMLAECGGRSGPAYRASLPGEMDVVVRVAAGDREAGEGDDAAAEFREMAKLRHPNLLPLLGYCVAGKEKLLLYEYMERGDLHRWLHELPAGRPDTEDWSADTWEPHHVADRRPTSAAATMSEDWPSRHRVALGVARGLAFLHQGWVGSAGRPVVHGNLVPTNVLLGDNLEPRIADFATYGGSEGARGTPEGDVYAYGLLTMELVTGRGGRSAEEVEKIRKLVKEGKGEEVVDSRIRTEVDGSGQKWEEEMLGCLRVAYLCTAQSPEKRPTMQQVVGLIKDIRPSPSSSSTVTTTASAC